MPASPTPTDNLHWYDFVCPFCYVGQQRTALLLDAGLRLTELPFEAHPEIPAEGRYVGPRSGPMFRHIEEEAKEAGLPLDWPLRLPNTRRALACAEWVRSHSPEHFKALQRELFLAHFARGQDLGDQAILDSYVQGQGIDVAGMHHALTDGAAYSAVDRSERLAHAVGVRGTPAWLLGGELIEGLQPVAVFQAIATQT